MLKCLLGLRPSLLTKRYVRMNGCKPIKDNENKLLIYLYNKIKHNGPISVAEFMREALSNQKYGYYIHKDMLGESGDFVTSPELSQMFGELLAFWFVNYWKNSGAPAQMQLIELGPGRGTMMGDVLRTFHKLRHVLNGVDLTVHMVEISDTLSKIQFEQLTGSKSPDTNSLLDASCPLRGRTKHDFEITWHRDVAEVPDGRFTMLIAHEFFDALPIHKFIRTKDGWREVYVDVDVGLSTPALRYVLLRQPTIASKTLLLEGERRNHVEVSPRSGLIMQAVADKIHTNEGAALVVDYGHNGTNEDTLRAFKRHEQCDVLKQVGQADVTADVDFHYLRHVVSNRPVHLHGPVSQHDFLKRMGIDVLLAQMLRGCASDDERRRVRASYDMIVDDMGAAFKCMAVTSHDLRDLDGRPTAVAGFS